MSNLVFPSFPGLTYPVYRIPTWNTRVKKTASGREFRSRMQLYPIVQYRLKYSFLRDTAALQHLQQLEGFFNQVGGDFDSFLFEDPDDRSVAGEQFGIGDGVRTAWQLTRARGGFIEPVYDLNGTPEIYLDGVRKYAVRRNYFRNSDDLRDPSEKGSASNWEQVSSADTQVTRTPVTDWNGVNRTVNFVNSTAVGQVARSVSQVNNSFPDNTPATLSCYAKSGACQYLALAIVTKDNLVPTIRFNLADGTYVVESAPAGITMTAGAEALANGWFRLWVKFSSSRSGVTNFRGGFYLRNANGTVFTAGGAGQGCYVMDAQLEDAADVTAYILNTSATVVAEASDYAVSNSGVVTLAAAPGLAALLTWSGSYYWRCRFTMPQLELQKFLSTFWEAGKVEFKVDPP